MTDTPSKAALNLAVKPAGFRSWDHFTEEVGPREVAYNITLAYAADLDKADKQNREVLALLDDTHHLSEHDQVLANEAAKLLRANLVPDPIDPDLLEAEELEKEWRKSGWSVAETLLRGIRRGRELAKEQGRG